MTPVSIFGIIIVLAWVAYEAFRMRRHRSASECVLHLVASVLEKLEQRQTIALTNDATIAKTLETIERRLSKSQDNIPPA